MNNKMASSSVYILNGCDCDANGLFMGRRPVHAFIHFAFSFPNFFLNFHFVFFPRFFFEHLLLSSLFYLSISLSVNVDGKRQVERDCLFYYSFLNECCRCNAYRPGPYLSHVWYSQKNNIL